MEETGDSPREDGKTGNKEWRMTLFSPCPELGTIKPGHGNRVSIVQPWPWAMGSLRLRGYPPWVAASLDSIFPAPQRIWAHGGSKGWQQQWDGLQEESPSRQG